MLDWHAHFYDNGDYDDKGIENVKEFTSIEEATEWAKSIFCITVQECDSRGKPKALVQHEGVEYGDWTPEEGARFFTSPKPEPWTIEMQWDRSLFKEYLDLEKLDARFWGMYGEIALEELKKHISFNLNQDVSSFITQIGNASIEDYDLVFMGDPDSQNNCISVSKTAGLSESNNKLNSLIIMDYMSISYVLHADGTIKGYENDVNEAHNEIESYDSFTQFIEELIKLMTELNSR